MLLLDSTDLKSLLIKRLAQAPNSTASDLMAALESDGHRFSRRAFYKELKALESGAVLLKAGRTYALRIGWLINSISWFREAYLANVAQAPLGGEALFAKGSKFACQGLARLDFIWTQVIFALRHAAPKETICIWKPEQWFHLVHTDVTESYFKALGDLGAKQIHIIGHDCHTCRRGAAMIPKKHGKVVFKDNAFNTGLETYLTLIGDHLITIKISPDFALKMRQLFASIKSDKEMLSAEALGFMKQPVRATLRVDYKPRDLKAIRERFERIGGRDV
jgi:hypothetical protein